MRTHSIENEKILNQDNSSISLEFFVPLESDFFNGHFPAFKLLPAVGQVEMVTRFAKKYLGTPRAVAKIKRFKFSAPLLPNVNCQMDIFKNEDKKSVSFSLFEKENPDHVYSSGIFFYA